MVRAPPHGVDLARPPGVLGRGSRVEVLVDQRVALDDPGAQRRGVDEVEDQELVLAENDVIARGGYDVQAGEAHQHVAFAPQPGDRVAAVEVQARVRPRLLEHDPVTAAQLRRGVEPAGVGEVDGPLDAVGQLLDRDAVAGLQVRAKEPGQLHPRRHPEGRLPAVRHQRSGVVLDRQHGRAGLRRAVALGETPVPDRQRPPAPAQIAEDVWPAAPGKALVELGEHRLQDVLVERVDRDELATGGTVGVLRVGQQERVPVAQELERHPLREAVVPHRGQDVLGVVEAGRDVDLPPLRR